MSRTVGDTVLVPPRHWIPRSLTSSAPDRRCASNNSSTSSGTPSVRAMTSATSSAGGSASSNAPSNSWTSRWAECIEIEYRHDAVAFQCPRRWFGESGFSGTQRADDEDIRGRRRCEIPNHLDAVGIRRVQVVEQQHRATRGRGDVLHESHDAFERQEP